ncbi:MAG: hypothetical protein FRX49_01176 [Trebouxia sp. A1-2]|nr:MAG: hypothetical protein FRX49_01176 [Trebouxia sp. A1-2]
MAFQPYHTAHGANEHYAGQQQQAYDPQQALCYAPPDLLTNSHAEQACAPPLPDQPALYDPFSHADCLQQIGAASEALDAPPLPSDEAPPLPAEGAPPLPSEPPEQQQSFAAMQEASAVGQALQAAPAYLPPDQLHLNYAQQPQYQYENSQPQHQAAPPGWLTYQYPGQEAYQQTQQTMWHTDPYAHQYPTQSPPALFQQQQPWHTQTPAPWQQQQQQLQHEPHMHAAATQPPSVEAAPASQPVQEAPAKVVTDAASIFHKPGRASRPKRVAIVLRGLPGSGKSYTAKKLKDFEVQQGGDAPRIHAIDDYFVVEVEKEIEEEASGKKSRKRTVRQMEYCYEADLEGTYKASLMQAFERTVKEARFGMVLVDAPNVSADDLKGYWSAGQRGGYEVYMVEVTGATVEECHKRNIHNRSLADIQQAAAQWQQTPAVYPLLDLGPLLGLNKKKSKQGGIAEVEMEDESESAASEDEEESAQEPAVKPVSSRWVTEAEEQPVKSAGSKRALAQGQGPSKRAKPQVAAADTDDFDGLTAGLDGFFGKKQGRRGMHDNAKPTRGVLRKGGSLGGGGTRSVRWADQEPSTQTGFRIGGSQQLETIYVLEGLGPPKEHAPGSKSFKDQIKAEHSSERQNFRDVLLGGRRA